MNSKPRPFVCSAAVEAELKARLARAQRSLLLSDIAGKRTDRTRLVPASIMASQVSAGSMLPLIVCQTRVYMCAHFCFKQRPSLRLECKAVWMPFLHIVRCCEGSTVTLNQGLPCCLLRCYCPSNSSGHVLRSTTTRRQPLWSTAGRLSWRECDGNTWLQYPRTDEKADVLLLRLPPALRQYLTIS